MIIRKIQKNSSGQREFCFGHGYSDYLHENYEVAQDIETAILEFKNDCYFSLNSGIDWRTRLGYHNQKDLLDNDIQTIVTQRYGVISITSFESSETDREYNCKLGVYTIFSQDPIELELTQGL